MRIIMVNHWIDSSYEEGLVSVIIPLHNRQDLIADTLECIWNQTYRPIEIIVVDDGSTDRSVNVVKNWIDSHSSEDCFNSIIIMQPKAGAQKARNMGLIKSKGEYIQFIDSDDIISPNKIRSQIEREDKFQHVIVHGPWCTFYKKNMNYFVGRLNSITNGYYPFKTNDHILAWCKGGYEPIHSFLWPREVIQNIGPWDERLHANQDIDYLGRAIVQGHRIIYENNGISFYRIHEPKNRISGSLTIPKVKSFFRVCKTIEKYLIENNSFEEYKHAFAYRYYGIARKTVINHQLFSKLAMKYYHLYKNNTNHTPGSMRHRLLTSIMGLRLKEILSKILYRMRIPTNINKRIKCKDYNEMYLIYEYNNKNS